MGLPDDRAGAFGVKHAPRVPEHLRRLFERGATPAAITCPSRVIAEAAESKGKRQKRRSGRAARAAGEAFEQAVVKANTWYAARGLAFVRKAEPQIVMLGRPGADRTFRGRFIGKAPVDFSGALAPDGVALAFDAKNSNRPSLPLEVVEGPGRRRPMLRPEQREALASYAVLGAVAGLLVRVVVTRRRQPTPRWFWVPWTGWEAAEGEATAAGRASVGLALLEQHGHPCGALPNGAPDWLGAVQTWAEGDR